MARLTSYIIGGATLVCALGTGYVMQYGFGAPTRAPQAAERLELSGVVPATSAVFAPLAASASPEMPADLVLEMELPEAPMIVQAAAEVDLPIEDLPQAPGATGFACDITMTAEPTAGAMVNVVLTAPCRASERVTLHHQGLMFTEIMQPDGTLSVSVPALAEQAAFIASFPGGDGAMASAEVASLPFYDRVAVQWKGDAGLQLHAREFSAEYFAEGHIWAAAAGDLTAAAKGEGGFLTRLGRTDTPEALMAEIYSFPSGTARKTGTVLLSVEAEVTEANCGAPVEAQTLEIRGGGSLRTRDLSVAMPACDAVGDFLVLKNLVEDLTIASR
ncbi:translocase [Maliponia aquimaris]|uniref:Translocase n=1 Tax=Maliponia aquimaris TaxID=1673631 RepID=A0A238JT15_9RHOB|nr:translocase [Maliponia aquimaris]SMX33809.1 hypothetical protein MAA8898_00540 [Maliponia aquimaris]